jgi:DNA invertase Pin-like site-specific DNA recombinase
VGIAEFERELIKERTGEGRKCAQAADVKFGRKPKLSPFQRRPARHPTRVRVGRGLVNQNLPAIQKVAATLYRRGHLSRGDVSVAMYRVLRGRTSPHLPLRASD